MMGDCAHAGSIGIAVAAVAAISRKKLRLIKLGTSRRLHIWIILRLDAWGLAPDCNIRDSRSKSKRRKFTPRKKNANAIVVLAA
jgi:hypothetical protein